MAPPPAATYRDPHAAPQQGPRQPAAPSATQTAAAAESGHGRCSEGDTLQLNAPGLYLLAIPGLPGGHPYPVTLLEYSGRAYRGEVDTPQGTQLWQAIRPEWLQPAAATGAAPPPPAARPRAARTATATLAAAAAVAAAASASGVTAGGRGAAARAGAQPRPGPAAAGAAAPPASARAQTPPLRSPVPLRGNPPRGKPLTPPPLPPGRRAVCEGPQHQAQLFMPQPELLGEPQDGLRPLQPAATADGRLDRSGSFGTPLRSSTPSRRPATPNSWTRGSPSLRLGTPRASSRGASPFTSRPPSPAGAGSERSGWDSARRTLAARLLRQLREVEQWAAGEARGDPPPDPTFAEVTGAERDAVVAAFAEEGLSSEYLGAVAAVHRVERPGGGAGALFLRSCELPEAGRCRVAFHGLTCAPTEAVVAAVARDGLDPSRCKSAMWGVGAYVAAGGQKAVMYAANGKFDRRARGGAVTVLHDLPLKVLVLLVQPGAFSAGERGKVHRAVTADSASAPTQWCFPQGEQHRALVTHVVTINPPLPSPPRPGTPRLE
eukprot:TRINITY_DN70278_c0_g1_i1.p1 TRINITY_DN70278_c0_g1~~TRINITY_DN70278_c0_g1_i1.p1  ORF type:complete len:574 (+),score=107.78 TRINITY_DN70278_c0_g1_i1:80-1723(+)